MQKPQRRSSAGALKARRTRPARESGDICLNDVLNYVCSADRRNLRIIENTLAETLGVRFGEYGLFGIPIENCVKFIHWSNRKEFERIRQAVRDRKLLYELPTLPEVPDGLPNPAKALRRGKKALREFKVGKEVA